MNVTTAIDVRDLKTLEELREVIEIEKRVWGYPDAEEAIPLPILVAGVRRGAIVLGAFDEAAMVGATYSFPAITHRRLTHWSHMLGVVDSHRGLGIGRLLKLAQRQRALDMDVDLIEWTFDPLQAVNAHFNLADLGAVVEEYEVNVYGASTSPLWRGSDSDRFIAQWHISDPHVERRIARRRPLIRASDVVNAICVLEAKRAGECVEPGEPVLDEEGRRLTVEIPASFAPIQAAHPDLAKRWRAATRAVFSTYLPRGYRVVDFWMEAPRGCGTYLMARRDIAVRQHAA